MVSQQTPSRVWDTSSEMLREFYVIDMLEKESTITFVKCRNIFLSDVSSNVATTMANYTWQELDNDFKKRFTEFLNTHVNSDAYKQWKVSVRKTQELHR